MGNGRAYRRHLQQRNQTGGSSPASHEVEVRELSKQETSGALVAWRSVFEALDNDEDADEQLAHIARQFGAVGLFSPAMTLASAAVLLLGKTTGATVGSILDKIGAHNRPRSEVRTCTQLLTQMVACAAGFEDEFDLDLPDRMADFTKAPRLLALATVTELAELLQISAVAAYGLVTHEVDGETADATDPEEDTTEVAYYLAMVGTLVDTGHSLDDSVEKLSRWCGWLSMSEATILLLQLCQRRPSVLQPDADFEAPPEAACSIDTISKILGKLGGAAPDEDSADGLLHTHDLDCVVYSALWLLYRGWATDRTGMLFSDYLKLPA